MVTRGYTPIIRVEVDGVDRTRAIWENLVSISVEDSKSYSAGKLEFQINNSPAYAIPPRGSEVLFWLGYKETGLQFMGKYIVDEVSGELSPPAQEDGSAPTIQITDVIRGSWTLKGRDKYKKVKARWWNAKDAREETVEESNAGDSDTDGAEYVMRRRFASSAEAASAVKNKLANLNRGMLELSLSVLGDPSYKVGEQRSCIGFSPDDVNGLYFVTSLKHSFSKTAWETSIGLDNSPTSKKGKGKRTGKSERW